MPMPIQPIVEKPFEQEICTFYNCHYGLGVDGCTGVAVTADGVAWAANHVGVARFGGDRWTPIRDPKGVAGGGCSCLAADVQGALWVGTSMGVGRLKDGQWEHWYGDDAPTRWILDLAPDNKGGVWAVMSHDGDLAYRDVWHFDGSRWVAWAVGEVAKRQDPTSIALDGRGAPYVVLAGKVLRLRGKRWSRVNLKAGRAKALTVEGAPDGSVWVGTTEGVIVLRDGAPERAIGKAEGMPVAAVHGIALAPNGDVWFSHGVAASRMRGRHWRYYSPYTWFPGGSLSAVAIAPDGAVWFAAGQGVGRLQTRMMTLAEKSALLEPMIPARHLRHGYVMSLTYTEPDNPNADWHWTVSDNDGLHTARFCYPECFRYAVTKAPDARANARATLDALIHLVRITGKRGLLARAAFRKDDPKIIGCSGEWHESADGKWLWKGDTSSDEVDAHMMAYSVYYDLVADDEEKAMIASMMSDLMGGIVENGFVLLDLDGKHTRWGVWSPELLWSDQWQAQRKLNSMEMLSYLRTAHYITGEERFNEAYRDLVDNHGYAETVRTSQQATPVTGPSKFDDGLAFHAYYPLLKYETDPDLRAIYLDSLDRFWQFVREERTPIFTAMANIFLEKNENLDFIYEVLCGYRLDHASRPVVNKYRQDLEWRTMDGVRMLTRVLPGPERPHYGWNDNPFESEAGGWPAHIHTPVSFLIAYWLARYHGLIVPA